MGIFYRTIRMAENGIKPVYVFDGKPPDLKKGVVSLLCTFDWSQSEEYCSFIVGETIRET